MAGRNQERGESFLLETNITIGTQNHVRRTYIESVFVSNLAKPNRNKRNRHYSQTKWSVPLKIALNELIILNLNPLVVSIMQ